MAYCLYLRKSRADLEAEARGEGETLARHKKALLELGHQQHLNITHIYPEVVSGETIASRPVMQQLLSDVEQGAWEGVLVMEVERLARGDTIDQGIVAQTFKFSSTKIITPLKIYDPTNEYDEEYFEFGLFMSRREYKTINRRLQRGRIASVKEGKYVGNRAPYGYTRKKFEHEKGFTLISDPVRAPIVRMIFDLAAYGEKQPDGTAHEIGVSRIVRKLNSMRIPPEKGSAWVDASIRQILQNPVYIGKIRWNGRPVRKKMIDGKVVRERPRAKPENWILVDGRHEPLVDRKTWDMVQTKFTENQSHPAPLNRTIMNPLAGLVICGKCGRRMVRRPYTAKSYPDTLICQATSCDNISSALDLVEDRVLQALRQWLAQYRLSYDAPAVESDQADNKKGVLRAAQNELKKLEKQRDHIYDLLEQGIYTTDVFLERSKAAEEKIQKASDSIDRITREFERKKRTEQGRKIIIPRAEHVLAEYPKAKTPAEKNALLKSVIEKVIYTKTVNGRWHGRPDDFELVLYPKLPHESADH